MTVEGSVDPQGMLRAVRESPDQWREALKLARSAPIEPPADLSAVVIAGMGGSGIAGDVAALAADIAGRLPVVPVKGYRLPDWLSPETLVVAVSHSGDTEETLTCVEQAEHAGAPLVAVTSGGELGRRVEQLPTVATVQVPGHLQPRASLGYLAGPVLVLLERLGVLHGVEDQLAEAPGVLDALLEQWDADEDADAPRRLASDLRDLTPWFVGGSGPAQLVALRARCQVNENAERVAFHSTLPELDHNTIVGWAGGGPPESTALVEIRDPDEHPRVARRFEVTRDLVVERFAAAREVTLAGERPLVRFAAGVLFVDLLSVHLAIDARTDPTPVEAIDALKQRLSEAG